MVRLQCGASGKLSGRVREARRPGGKGGRISGEARKGGANRCPFLQRGDAGLAKLCLSHKSIWRRPNRALKLVTSLGFRGLGEYIKSRLRTIHPNPGPRQRNKTEDGIRRRRERRYEKRTEKRPIIVAKEHLHIATWNVQRMSLGTFNKRKARSVCEYARRSEWDAVLLSEIRSETNGVEWFGSGDNLTVIIHSKRAGILLRGKLLKEWCEDGQKKKQDERVVSVKMNRTVLISTYQPVWKGNNEIEIEEAKINIEDHKKWASKEDILLIGGDFNAHVGGGEDRPGVCGKWGLRESNYQGRELLTWCEENGLVHVNSYYNMKKRGTWFNHSNRKWYEIDGFLMRKEQRNKCVRKVGTVGEHTISDHKPKKITLVRKWNRYQRAEDRKSRVPNIHWERLKEPEVAQQFKIKTGEILDELDNNDEEDENEGETTNWKKITDTLTRAAKDVCGVKERHIENPWMVGKEVHVERMRGVINGALERRNNLMERLNVEDTLELRQTLELTITELKEGRKTMKREISLWEREWWEEILDECQNAGERGDTAGVYRNLKRLGLRGMKKAGTTTNLTKEQFKDHFQNVSKDRFENRPEDIEEIIQEVVDISQTDKAKEWRDILDEVPEREEIREQIKLMRDSAPGEDGVRLNYILKGDVRIFDEVVYLIQFMFSNSADKWEEALKIGLVIPLHKKGDKDNPNNFRGVVLLAMGSRILARIIANRLRIWAEKMELLDDNQSGFRKERSTADATQIMIRIQEDCIDLRRRQAAEGIDVEEGEEYVARLLDLRKAYPRINKPALWMILKRYGMGERCLRAIQDLHETTQYKIKSREGDSEAWIPQRGLREGCPSSPILFNIIHQAIMRIAKQKRKRKAEEAGLETGINYNWVPGSCFPNVSRWEKGNTDAKRVKIYDSLFADDTTPVGKKKELEEGLKTIKEVMNRFEERNNEDKEEELVFGTDEGDKIRMLGTYIGFKEDVKQRTKRAGAAWAKAKSRLKGSKMSKRLQARVIEACVESTLLFDCQARTWQVLEIKQLQKTVDKMYRYVWSRKTKPPLVQMQEEHKNMQDLRNELGVKSVRWKIEKRCLERIGHVMRMEDSRTVKAVVLGWLAELEDHQKMPGRKRKTVLYWKKLLKEAGIDWTRINQLTSDRKEWKGIVKQRMKNLEKWERGNGHRSTDPPGERNVQREAEITWICEYEGCERVCKSKAGLVNHTRKMHQKPKDKVTFKCDSCNLVFDQKGNLVNHKKGCGGAVALREGYKKCNICGKEVLSGNFNRHRRIHEDRDPQPRAAAVRGPRAVCVGCGISQSKANMARHQNKCPGGAAVL